MVGSAPHLFCFGLGYSAGALARKLLAEGWRISGTARSAARQQALAAAGILAHRFDRARPLADGGWPLRQVTDVLISVPPDEAGDVVLDLHRDALVSAGRRLRWVGYLSTTGVYGDTGGRLVDEAAPLQPTSARAGRRVQAEARWLELQRRHGLPIHVFRLAGIYGPGRSAIDQVQAGEARRVIKPGHVFSRIHVDDIATVVRSSMARPNPGRIYNVCDNEPAEPADVVTYACGLLGVEPPPPIPFASAAQQMSPMALSFWRDNRRVDNARMRQELGVALRYPSYREGLQAVLAQQRTPSSQTTMADASG
jgi:nucleoside-diphosphate-sugar epimerase